MLRELFQSTCAPRRVSLRTHRVFQVAYLTCVGWRYGRPYNCIIPATLDCFTHPPGSVIKFDCDTGPHVLLQTQLQSADFTVH